MLISPYSNEPRSNWLKVTQQLIDAFPLSKDTIIAIVESAWEDIYSSSFGQSNLKIGRDIFLPAQAIGVIFEKLIAFRLAQNHAGWRSGQIKQEKDIVYTLNERYCFEIKTSCSKSGLYGNRSTGHTSDNRVKYRTGYYLVINYKLPTAEDLSRKLWQIRFGWIDDTDWRGQSKPSGQQASLSSELTKLKLITLKSY
jgi:hypothetical protein